MARRGNRLREEIYDRARGELPFPICSICGMEIQPGQKWHVNHDARLPKAIGGAVDGISHARCNLRHAQLVAVPQIAKAKRIRQKHIGAWKTRRPLPGSRSSNIKITVDRQVIDRRTGAPWHARKPHDRT